MYIYVRCNILIFGTKYDKCLGNVNRVAEQEWVNLTESVAHTLRTKCFLLRNVAFC